MTVGHERTRASRPETERTALVLLAAAAFLGCVALLLLRPAPAASVEPKVTVIGDSVMTSVQWYPGPTATLEQDLDLHLEVAVCRRLTGPSCPFQGTAPPNLLQVVAELGHSLGPTVVVVMGYNDHESSFPASVEATLTALHRAGVTRVIWASLRAARHSYVHMNEILDTAAKSHPELTIADWNTYSRSHPEWFQNDGIHLEPNGGAALATFLHQAIENALAKPLPLLVLPGKLPPAHVGRAYRIALGGANGHAPYRFSIASGKLPRGLKLLPSGRIDGRPLRAGRAQVEVRVVDADRRSSEERETIVVAG